VNDHLPPLSYAPDGLYEADVDSLISEYFAVVPELHTVADKEATNRHVRRLTRRTIDAAFLGRSAELQADDTAA
jgi:hypothetical protein